LISVFLSLHSFEVVFARGPLRGLFYAWELYMKTRLLGRALLLSLALAGTAPAFALPLTDMRPDVLLAMAPDFRKTLNLNANQQTLWQQVEGKSRAILRERQARREKLQQQASAGLDKPSAELREVGALLDAEEAASAAENRQLRELWLTVNDALDDNQRRQVVVFVTEQMQRVDGPEGHGVPAGKEEGGRGRGGRGRGGMSGGMGGGRPGGGMPGE
jgi:hypothetical protein